MPTADLTSLTNNALTNTDLAAVTTATRETRYRHDGVGNWVERTLDSTPTTFTPDQMNAYGSIGGLIYFQQYF